MGMGTGRTVGQTRFCVGGLRVTMGKLLRGLGWEGDPWRAGADHLQQSAAGAQADPSGNSSGFKGASSWDVTRQGAAGSQLCQLVCGTSSEWVAAHTYIIPDGSGRL